jgi:hypothetical protein
MQGFSDLFIVDCTEAGFQPPALMGAASILKSDLFSTQHRVQVLKDSEAAKKAWIKIHQNNALKGLDKLSEDIAKMHSMPEGKAKQKAMDKISAQSAHLEHKYVSNGGEHAKFLDAQINAYNKAASMKPPKAPNTGLQDLHSSFSTTTPHVAHNAPTAPPKWEEPNSLTPDLTEHPVDQNHKLGVAYYMSREKNGKDHADTKAAYDEWQKSKDYLKKSDGGFDSSSAAVKSKDAATKLLASEKNSKEKAMTDLHDKAYAHAYAAAKDMHSNATHQAESWLQNQILIAQDEGHSPTDLVAAVDKANKAALAAVANEAQAAQAMKAILSGDHANVIKYHDKTKFEDLEKYSSDSNMSDYAVNARKITDGYTTAQQEAIKHYGGSGYTAQNKAVVAGDDHKQAEILKKVLDGASLPVDAKLRRNMPQKWFWKALGVGENEMSHLNDEQILSHVGKTYTEDAFSSTSKDHNFSSAFGNTAHKSGKLKLNIRAPKGSQGVDISYLMHNHGEAEVILNRGATYVIRSIKKMSGHGKIGLNSDFVYEANVDLIGFKKEK